MRRAAVQTHNAVFSQTEGSVIIDLANVGVIALQFLKTQNPGLARDLAEPQQIALKLSDRSLTVVAVRAAEASGCSRSCSRCWRSRCSPRR